MAERTLTTLLTEGTFFEGPRWHDGRWWVSDFYRHLVLAITPDGTAEEVVTVAAQPSGLGWTPAGDLRIVSMKDNRLLELSSGGGTEVVADLSPWSGGPSNDMVIDAEGRAYIGNFGFDLMGGAAPVPATIVRVDLDGSVTLAAEDMLFPNGSVVTPDGRTLIVGESMGNRFTAFTIGEGGELADRRVWAELAPPPTLGSFEETFAQLSVLPDGCGLDAEGQIWVADAGGARVLRVAEGGGITDEIRAPEGLGVFACMLGGDDGQTLLMCCAPDFSEHARSVAREAVLLATRVDVPHAGLP